MNPKFPLYRKSLNGKHYYIIHNTESMTEVQMIGTQVYRFEIKATLYPDLMRIQSIIELSDGSVTEVSPGEKEEVLKMLHP